MVQHAGSDYLLKNYRKLSIHFIQWPVRTGQVSMTQQWLREDEEEKSFSCVHDGKSQHWSVTLLPLSHLLGYLVS